MIYQSTLWIIIFLAAVTFVVPRKYFLLSYIIAACFVPADQRIIIMGLDFTILRILVVVGVVRVFVRGEKIRIQWNKFDRMVFAWVACGTLIYIIQWMSLEAMIYRSGILFDVLGMYWLFRQRIRTLDDIKLVAKFLALSALILAPLVALEWSTGRNPFVILGRVITDVREERYRCQAAFPHSIMLGLFWATLVPVFIGLAVTERHKYLYWAAVGSAIFIICGTASSTPIATLLYIFVLLPLFPYRKYGKTAFYYLCGLLFVLHLIMNNPVWHLIARANIVGGSTGWHRYFLINEAINHFNEWALIGVKSVDHWGSGLSDVTNQYVLEGLWGGLVTLVLFIIILVMSVQITGRYSLRTMPVKQQGFGWCLCVCLLAHCMSFIGVSYFGQIMMLLYLTFAFVGFIYEKERESIPLRRRVTVRKRMAVQNLSGPAN